MYGKKAIELYELLKAKGIVGAQGNIKLDLLNTSVDINDKSATGNLLQEWLGHWMTNNGIPHRENANTQEFPDFYLSDSNKYNLLEIKTFDYDKSPNFDVAQFDAYVRSVRTKAYRLDADYLIFGYSLSNGSIVINNIWLKKIWEITCGSEKYALRTQVKQEKIYNIRPYNFKTMPDGHPCFNDMKEFTRAIRDTLEKYKNDAEYADIWNDNVTQSYRAHLAERGLN